MLTTEKDAANIGFDDDFIYQEIEVAPQYRKKPSEILLRDEAIKVFQLWDEKLDKNGILASLTIESMSHTAVALTFFISLVRRLIC